MGKVILVKASAGSGKTLKLASAFVKKLFEDCQRGNRSSFQNIVAITFTRAATKEMVVRVLNYLIGLSTGTAEKHVVNEIAPNLTENQRREIASCILEEIFKNFSLLRISTIDSLVTSIFRSSLYVKNLPPHLEVLPGAEGIYRRAMEMGLDIGFSDKNGKTWIKQLVMDGYKVFKRGSFDIYSWLEGILKEYFYAMILRDIKVNNSLFNIDKLVDDIHSTIRQIENLDCAKNGLKKLLRSYEITLLLGFLQISNFDSSIKKKCSDNPSIQLLVNNLYKLHDQAKQVFWEIMKNFSFTVYQLLKSGVTIFNNLIIDEGSVPLDYSMKLLVDLIKKYRFPGSYIFLAERVNYLLIDEFQDTSDAQWEFLEPVAENVVAEGGTFFAVGDPKQTIYFWRGSREDIFSEVTEKFDQFSQLKSVILGENFRSAKEIIEFVNRFFNPCVWKKKIKKSFNKNNNMSNFYREVWGKVQIYLDKHYNVTHFTKKKGGYVEIRLIEEGNKDSNLEIIVKSLKEIIEDQVYQKGYSYRDIAILLRKRNEIRKISSYLMANNIPVKTSHGLNVLDEILVKEIVSLLKFLNNPSDDLSFLQFVGGEIFRSATGDRIPAMEDFLEKLLDSQSLHYIAFKENYSDLWSEFFADIFRKVGFTPVADLIWLIYERFRILTNFPNKRPLFIHFVEVVRNIEERNSDINSFLESLESGEIEEEAFVIPSQESADAVTISTYHKAKGLEWPIVILPYVTMVFNWWIFNPLNPPLIVNSDGTMFILKNDVTPLLDGKRLHLGVKEYLLQIIGEINALYVATTRARDKLFMFVPVSRNVIPEILREIFPFKDKTFALGENTPKDKEKNDRESLTRLEMIHPSSISPPLSVYSWRNNLLRKSEEFRELDENEIRRMKKGTFYHAVLERIKYLDNPEEQVRKIIEMLIRDHEFRQLEEDKDLMFQKLIEFLSDRKIQKFFSRTEHPENMWEINNEFEIVNRKGETFRIDRFMKSKDDSIIIIDYKTTFDDLETYEQQVRNYGKIVKEIFNTPEEKISLLLLSIEEKEIHHVTFN